MNQNEQITEATKLSPLRITVLLCVIAFTILGFVIPWINRYRADQLWAKKTAEAVAYMQDYKYSEAEALLNEIVRDRSRSEEDRSLYFSYLKYVKMMEAYFGNSSIEYQHSLASGIHLPEDDPFYASWKRISSRIGKEYAPIEQQRQKEAEEKRRAREMIDEVLKDIDGQLRYFRGYGLTDQERAEAYDAIDSGKTYTPNYYKKSSGGSYSSSSGSKKHYDPYDVDNYDDPDDFADDWADDFEDYDDAYDYWEENH